MLHVQMIYVRTRVFPKELTHKGDVLSDVFFPGLLSRSCVKFMQEIVKNRSTGTCVRCSVYSWLARRDAPPVSGRLGLFI